MNDIKLWNLVCELSRHKQSLIFKAITTNIVLKQLYFLLSCQYKSFMKTKFVKKN